MSDIIISIENVSKRYMIGHKSAQQERYKAFRDVIGREARDFVRKASDLLRGQQIVQGDEVEEFWALKDVSLEVRRGDIVGIIGRNGAGKSTLLKILSRITKPTKGRVRLRGRVGSLLEVGTGFHPELTGRENIFLNGAILGMSRAEIRKKFDEIVDFADIARFLDTPVKRYSSGMYVRLAFAVAAHLEPEILIVDEVLAVGDAEFQRKCLGKMGAIAATEGRTVLFVSHNLPAIATLCGPAVWLADGKVLGRGPSSSIIEEYLRTISAPKLSARLTRRHVGPDVRVEFVELLVDHKPSTNIQAGQTAILRVHFQALSDRSLESLSCSIMLFLNGQKFVNLWTKCQDDLIDKTHSIPKKGFLDCIIPKWPFRNGTIRTDVYTHFGHETQDWVEEALTFHSHDGDFFGSGVIPDPDQGVIFVDHRWSFSVAAE
jgi:lipopolysaccharide transport system ATP-binding protein